MNLSLCGLFFLLNFLASPRQVINLVNPTAFCLRLRSLTAQALLDLLHGRHFDFVKAGEAGGTNGINDGSVPLICLRKPF